MGPDEAHTQPSYEADEEVKKTIRRSAERLIVSYERCAWSLSGTVDTTPVFFYTYSIAPRVSAGDDPSEPVDSFHE